MGNFPKLPKGTELTVGSHAVTIVEYLSEGGFAHIYKVQIDPKENDSEIACLKRVLVPDKNGLNQLRKEVDVMKILRNGRNIVKYYDSHAERLEDGTYQVLVLMELCPNKSLLDYMNAKIKTKLTEPEIINIMYDISLGIYEMHRLNMIHRDIKIENVLIDSKNRFKLCDFGSTTSPIPPPKDQHQFQLLSHDILYQTTPQYRSPEMIDLYRGFPIDEKSDIWALGCFLYKLCYYTTPFEATGDISILHASYQFLPAPLFSGDLKNLIIIMLQENPMFRPNIVQVIILLAKMLEIDFNDIGIEDFYKLGSYNFQALHEYQKQKQKEIIKQQQMYYQQQQQLAAAPVRPSASASVSPNVPPQDIVYPERIPSTQLSANTSTHPSTNTSTHPSTVPSAHVSNQATQASRPVSTHLERSKSLLEQPSTIEDKRRSKNEEVKRRSQHEPDISQYDPEISRSQYEPEKRQSRYEEKTIQYDQLDLKNSDGEQETEELEDEVSFGDLENLDNVEERYPSLEDILDDSSKTNQPSAPEPINPLSQPVNTAPLYAPPIKPIVLSIVEVKKLTKEQLKQYNHQHEVYQQQLKQYHYQQQLDQRNHYAHHQPQPPRQQINSNQDGTEYEKKEAWERRQVQINKSAEKLVDDIFAESPPTKSSQSASSVTSHKEVSRNPSVGKTNEKNLSEAHNSEPRSFEERESSEIKDDSRNLDSNSSKYGSLGKVSDEPFDDKIFDSDEFQSSKTETAFPDLLEFENLSKAEQSKEVKESVTRPIEIPTKLKPPHIGDNTQIKYATASSVPTLASNSSHGSSNVNQNLGGNPFPFKQPKPIQKVIDESTKEGINKDSRKSANPWGEYRKNTSTSSIPISKVKSHPVPGYVQDTNQQDSQELQNTTSRNSRDETIEPNLIDLEVGLESSSSSSATPVLKPKTNNSSNKDIYSLGSDLSLLDLDVKESKPQTPQFKKRISSVQNPSQFSFQEEVIDFASDDENPENGSRMNRLSIRNSLKKPKSRKSSENKRVESSSEPKKRISFFGGSRTDLTTG